MVKEKFPWVRLIENKRNLGFAGGNNVGIRKARGDYIFLLNNDIEVTKGWLTKLVDIGEKYPEVGIIGCKMLYPDGKLQHGGQVVNLLHISENITFYNKWRMKYDPDKEGEREAIVGAALLVRREVFRRIGLLDEKYSPIYREETDFCLRARKAGFKIYYTPESVIIHHEGVTMKRVGWKFYAWRKNSLRFILIHFPVKWLVFWLLFQMAWIGDALLRGEFLNLLRAYRDILNELPEILEKRRKWCCFKG